MVGKQESEPSSIRASASVRAFQFARHRSTTRKPFQRFADFGEQGRSIDDKAEVLGRRNLRGEFAQTPLDNLEYTALLYS